MKKIVISLLLGVGLFLGALGGYSLHAADSDLIELYPYDNPNNMTENLPIDQGVRTGKSNWTVQFGGYRYHGVRSSTLFAKDFDDKNTNGTIEASEMGATLSWTSFGAIWINDTDEEFILSTESNRAELTGNANFIWMYFDEAGRVSMFEDVINEYWIVDEGTATETDYRLATKAEATGWDADVETKPENARKTFIRILADSKATRGYLLEPIGYTKWNNPEAEDKLSTILPEGTNPSFVTLKPGFSALSMGTIDRNGTNTKTLDFIRSIPALLVEGKDKAEIKYTNQGPTFGDTLIHLDKDKTQPGINYVVEVNSKFNMDELINGVSSTFTRMYDADGKILNAVQNTDYEIDVVKDEKVLETITVTYDSEAKKYTQDKDITTIKTNVFGDQYGLVYRAVSPVDEKLVTEREVEVIVGVFSPKFNNLPKYALTFPEGEAIYDLLNPTGKSPITSDDGYGKDLTPTIKATTNGFNQFNPKAGEYTVDLEFIYDYVLKGVEPVVKYKNGENDVVTPYKGFNFEHGSTNAADVHIYDKEGYANIVAKWETMAWTSELLIIEDGKVVMAYSRAGNNNLMNEENPKATGSPENTNKQSATWFKDLELTENQLAVVIRGTSSIAINPWAKAVEYGTPFEVVMEVPDLEHQFIIKASYDVIIDDITPPELIVTNPNYKVDAGTDLTKEQVIKDNVILLDNYSNGILIIVSDGGLDLNVPGEYTIKVKATDEAGNETDEYTFKITVVENTSASDLAQLNDQIAKLKKQNTTFLIVSIVASVALAGGAFAAAFFLGKKK